MRKGSKISLNGNSEMRGPTLGEIEISMFGPGYGESLLLHVGDNNWLLVDSCVDPFSKKPAATEYLQRIGVDPSEAVKLVVASHWHDDHIRGLGNTLRECENAIFAFSSALKRKEFLTLVFAFGKRSLMDTSGVNEFYSILKTLKERKETGLGIPKFAIADRLIWKKELSPLGVSYDCEVYSLSPSDESVRLALEEIGRLLPREREPKRRLVDRSPNHNAVVLLVRVGELAILMGADLENTTHPGSGWSAIVTSGTRPQGRGCVFKIPHHGSINADHSGVWDEMLIPDPIALLSPFISGKTRIPTRSDVKRLRSRTSYGYSTADMKDQKPKMAQRVVDKTVNETVKSIRKVNPQLGHIRVRRKAVSSETPWEVTLFSGAVSVSSLFKD
jgi:beta-lactamase superfamily II metal-dependent hydrolase